jgi:hypothetical protein
MIDSSGYHPTMSRTFSDDPARHSNATSSFPGSETTTETAAFVASVGSSEQASPNSNANLLPLILALILTVFGLAGLVVLWYCFYKRRKVKRVAPSAEFKVYQRRSSVDVDFERGSRGRWSSDGRLEAYRDRGEEVVGRGTPDRDAPPGFAPRLFKDPIFEKGVAMSLARQSRMA